MPWRSKLGSALLPVVVLAGCAGAIHVGPPPAPARGPAGSPVAPAGDVVARGVALYEAGRFAEAESLLRTASGTDAQAYLAASIVKQGRHAEGEAAARAVLAIDPVHPVAVAALGEALVAQGRYGEAIGSMSDAIARRPDLAYAYYWRGQARYRKKQFAMMISDLQTFLRLAPHAPEAPAVQQLLDSVR